MRGISVDRNFCKARFIFFQLPQCQTKGSERIGQFTPKRSKVDHPSESENENDFEESKMKNIKNEDEREEKVEEMSNSSRRCHGMSVKVCSENADQKPFRVVG